jgi:hypothetical protein
MPTRMSAVKIVKFISHNLAKVRRLSEVSCTMSIQPFSHLTVANLSIPKFPFCPKGERTAAAPHHLPPLPPPQSSSSSLFPIIHWTYSDSPLPSSNSPILHFKSEENSARNWSSPPLHQKTYHTVPLLQYYSNSKTSGHIMAKWIVF